MGTMITPPICCATRGSFTRALTITPATTDERPTAGPSRKTPASHDASVTTPNNAGPYTSDASATNTTYVAQPASTPGTSAAIALPASSSTVRIGAASTGSSERD